MQNFHLGFKYSPDKNKRSDKLRHLLGDYPSDGLSKFYSFFCLFKFGTYFYKYTGNRYSYNEPKKLHCSEPKPL